jgi:hypothetical protein
MGAVPQHLLDLLADEEFISDDTSPNSNMVTSAFFLAVPNSRRPLEPATPRVEAGRGRAVVAGPFGPTHAVLLEADGQDFTMPTRTQHPGGQP